MEVIKNEFISKLEVVRILQKAYAEGRIKAEDGCVSLLDDINALPTTDVQPVKHGRWKLTNNPSFRKCSECGAWWSSDITNNCFTNYCPKCGARMDGDTE